VAPLEELHDSEDRFPPEALGDLEQGGVVAKVSHMDRIGAFDPRGARIKRPRRIIDEHCALWKQLARVDIECLTERLEVSAPGKGPALEVMPDVSPAELVVVV
jgi:hypothetical protein